MFEFFNGIWFIFSNWPIFAYNIIANKLVASSEREVVKVVHMPIDFAFRHVNSSQKIAIATSTEYYASFWEAFPSFRFWFPRFVWNSTVGIFWYFSSLRRGKKHFFAMIYLDYIELQPTFGLTSFILSAWI